MTDPKIDNKLLMRVADAMETAGAGYLDVSTKISVVNAKTDSAHARLKRLEDVINGSSDSSQGLKTRVALIEQDVSGGKTAKAHESNSNTSRTQILLTIAAIAIAFASMVASCGPQWAKALTPGTSPIRSEGPR